MKENMRSPSLQPIINYCIGGRLLSRATSSMLLATFFFFTIRQIVLQQHYVLLLVHNQSISTTITQSSLIPSFFLQQDDDQPINQQQAPGLSSCYRSRPRMVYPNKGMNGCYTEPNLPKDINSMAAVVSRTYCRYTNLFVDLSKIKSKRMGGERMVGEIIGQSEANEFLTYEKDAFIVVDNDDAYSTTKAKTNASTYDETPLLSLVIQDEQQLLSSASKVNSKHLHYLKQVLMNMKTFKSTKYNNNDNMTETCSVVVPGTTYLIQRYEYVNFYHTMTDWFNTWLAIDTLQWQQQQQQKNVQQQNQQKEEEQQRIEAEQQAAIPVEQSTPISIRKQNQTQNQQQQQQQQQHVIFLDAHPAGLLDDTWNVLFDNYSYVRQYHRNTMNATTTTTPYSTNNNNNVIVNNNDDNNMLCLEDAVFVPAGYSSELYLAHPYESQMCKDYVVTNRFIQFVLDKLGCQNIQQNPYHIVYIDRKPFTAHPRAKNDYIQRTITNLQEVAQTVQSRIQDTIGVSSTYDIVQLDKYTVKEQIQLIRSAHVLIGYHGAGLTHLLFMQFGSYVLEIDYTGYTLFQTLAQWTQGAVTHKLLPKLNILNKNGAGRAVVDNISKEYLQEKLLPEIQSIFQSYKRRRTKKNKKEESRTK